MLRLFVKIIILYAAMLALAGCMPPKVEMRTVKYLSMEKPAERIYVISKFGSSFPDTYRLHLAPALSELLNDAGTKAGSLVLTGLELNRDIARREVKTFSPDVILILRGIDIDSKPTSYTSVYECDAVMYIPESGEVVWKSVFELTFDIHTGRDSTHQTAQKLVESMQKDGIIQINTQE